MRIVLIPLLFAVAVIFTLAVLATPPKALGVCGPGGTHACAVLFLVVMIGLLLTGCVDSEQLRSNLGGPATDSKAGNDAKKQTLASKALGAIALEAVTRRKLSPARLNELH